jgi:hypothetical protein
MDGLTLNIINGDRKALALAKTCVTTPMLINYDIRQGAIYAIPLSVETNQKQAAADVSESLIISTDAKKNIADNVAPGSKSWRLSGYIKGIPSLEPSNYFQPFVQMHEDILWSWFERGAVLVFKDGDAHFYENIVIKDLQTSQQKDSANAVPFTMTLKELNTMTTNLVDLQDLASGKLDPKRILSSIPVIGSTLGAPLTLGMTSAETVGQTA